LRGRPCIPRQTYGRDYWREAGAQNDRKAPVSARGGRQTGSYGQPIRANAAGIDAPLVRGADLMKGPADEVVEAFFGYANRAIFEHEHVSYDLNGVMKHKGRNVVIGMGILHLQGHDDGLPFTITINPASAG
jgi:hypothetical protein